MKSNCCDAEMKVSGGYGSQLDNCTMYMSCKLCGKPCDPKPEAKKCEHDKGQYYSEPIGGNCYWKSEMFPECPICKPSESTEQLGENKIDKIFRNRLEDSLCAEPDDAIIKVWERIDKALSEYGMTQRQAIQTTKEINSLIDLFLKAEREKQAGLEIFKYEWTKQMAEMADMRNTIQELQAELKGKKGLI